MMQADDERSLISGLTELTTATRRTVSSRYSTRSRSGGRIQTQTPPSSSSISSSPTIISNLLSVPNLQTIAYALFVLTAFRIIWSSGNRDSSRGGLVSKQRFADRDNCQIVYVLGVEGSIHHGFTPILQTLAKQQVDKNEDPYLVEYADGRLRKALFGFHNGNTTAIDDRNLIKNLFRKKLCPNDGRKYVYIEDISFPSGYVYNETRTYRVKRQEYWAKSDMYTIAKEKLALNHPLNLYKFVGAYSQYAEIKFVVIHRSFVETIASHTDFDGNIQHHSNVIRGFLLLIRHFLMRNPFDTISGQKLWTVVCMERLMAKYYSGDEAKRARSRQNILTYLSLFLNWPISTCEECWDKWHDSTKVHGDILGESRVKILQQHMKELEGLWPPLRASDEEVVEEQICSL